MEPSPLWLVLVLLIFQTPTCDSHKEKYLIYFKNGNDKIPITVEMDLREKVAFAYSDGPSKAVSSSLYDYKANMVAYKDRTKKVCFLEKLDERSFSYDRRLLQSLRHQVLLETPDILIWDGSPLTRRQVLVDAGRRIGHFCGGFLTYKISSDSKSGRAKRDITDSGNYQRTYSHHEQLTQSYSKFGHEAVSYNGQRPESLPPPPPSVLLPNGTLPNVDAGKVRSVTRTTPVKIQPKYIWRRRSVRNGRMSRITRGLAGKNAYVPAYSQGGGTAGQIISHITHGGNPGATGRFDLSSSHAAGSGGKAGGYGQSGIGSQAYSDTSRAQTPQGYASGQQVPSADYGQVRAKSDKRYPASAIDYGLQARPAPAAGIAAGEKVKPAQYPGTGFEQYVPGGQYQQGISVPLKTAEAKREGKAYPTTGFGNQHYPTRESVPLASAALSGKNKEGSFPTSALNHQIGQYQPSISVPLRGGTSIKNKEGILSGSGVGIPTGQYQQGVGAALKNGFKIKSTEGQYSSSGIQPGHYQPGDTSQLQPYPASGLNVQSGQYPSSLSVPLQTGAGIKNKDSLYPGSGLGIHPGQYPSGLTVPLKSGGSGIKNKDSAYPGSGSGLGIQPGQYPSGLSVPLQSGAVLKNKDIYPSSGLGIQSGQYSSGLSVPLKSTAGIKNKDSIYPSSAVDVQPGRYPSGLSIPLQSGTGVKNKDIAYPGVHTGSHTSQYPTSDVGIQSGQHQPSLSSLQSSTGIKNKGGIYPGSAVGIQPGQYSNSHLPSQSGKYQPGLSSPLQGSAGIKNKEGLYPGSATGIQPGQYSDLGLTSQPAQYQPGVSPTLANTGIKNKDGIYPSSGLAIQPGQYPGSGLGIQPGQYQPGLSIPTQINTGAKNKEGSYPSAGLGLQSGQYQPGLNIPFQAGTGLKNKDGAYRGSDQALHGQYPGIGSGFGTGLGPTLGGDLGPTGGFSGIQGPAEGTQAITPGVSHGQTPYGITGTTGVGGLGTVGAGGLGSGGIGGLGTGDGVGVTGYGTGESGVSGFGIRPELYGTGAEIPSTLSGVGGLIAGPSDIRSVIPGRTLETGGGDGGLSSQSQVQLDDRRTNAGSSAQGAYGGGTTQSQVQGGATKNGTFQAQAQSTFLLGSSQSQTQGSEAGAQSSASSQLSDLGQSQTQAQLSYDSRSAQATAQTSSRLGSISTQSQGGRQGGQASSQAQGRGGTSSSAQVGFDEATRDRRRNGQAQPDIFSGKATAVSQGGFKEGQSQTQVSGDLDDGNKYSATAQGSYGEKEYPEGSPLAIALPGTGQDFLTTGGFPTSSIQQPSSSGASAFQPDSLQTSGFQSPTQGILGARGLYPSGAISQGTSPQSYIPSSIGTQTSPGTSGQFAPGSSTDLLGRRDAVPGTGDLQLIHGDGTVRGQPFIPSSYLQGLGQGVPLKDKNKPLTSIQSPSSSHYPATLAAGTSQKVKPYQDISPAGIPSAIDGLGEQLRHTIPIGYDGKVKPSTVVQPVLHGGGLQSTDGISAIPYGLAPSHFGALGINIPSGAAEQTVPTKIKDIQGLNFPNQQNLQGSYGNYGVPGLASNLGTSAGNLPSGITGTYGNVQGQGLSQINPVGSSGSLESTNPLNAALPSGYSQIPNQGITGGNSGQNAGVISTAQTDGGVLAQVRNSEGEGVTTHGQPTNRQAQAQGIYIGGNGFRTRIFNGRTGQQPQITQIGPESYVSRTSDSGPYGQSQAQSVHLGSGLLGNSNDHSQLQSDAAAVQPPSQSSRNVAGESVTKVKQDLKASRNHTRSGSHHKPRSEQKQPNGRRGVRNRASQLLRSLPLTKETGSEILKKTTNCNYMSCSNAYRLTKTVKICRRVMCS